MPFIVTTQRVPEISFCACCDILIPAGLAWVVVFQAGLVEDYCDACFDVIRSWR